jgi:hypothetical protein
MEYTIQLQPDLTRTLNDPGIITFRLQLIPDQLDGIRAMARMLFEGDTSDHLIMWLISLSQQINLVVPDRNEVTVEFNADAGSEMYHAIEEGLTWREAITYVFPESSIPITQRYTAIFWSLVNTLGIIVQFDNLEFLQGAISMCQWFRLDWHQHIADLHDGDTEVEISNL